MATHSSAEPINGSMFPVKMEASHDISFDRDKSLMRTQLQAGFGEEAREGSTVTVRFSVYSPGDPDELTVFDSDSTHRDGIRFIVGQTLHAEALDRAVVGTAPGSVVEVICVDDAQAQDGVLHIQPPKLSEAAKEKIRRMQMNEFAKHEPSIIEEQNIKFKQEVREWQPPVSLTRWRVRLDSATEGVIPVLLKWPQQDRLAWATTQKEFAQTLLQAGQVARACRRYKKSMLDLEIPTDWTPEELLIQRNRLRLALHLNICHCALKIEHFDEAIWHASRALLMDKSNVKALFRRGSAQLLKPNNPNGLEEAIADLSRASQLDPSNKEIGRILVKARMAQKDHDKQQAALCSRMLAAAAK